MQLKEMLKEKEEVTVPMQDMWRVKYLWTLLCRHYIGATEQRYSISELINNLCIN